VDGTGSGSCPVAGFGIGDVEPSGSATGELVTFHCITTNFVCVSVLHRSSEEAEANTPLQFA
jgi:hypothetical protein